MDVKTFSNMITPHLNHPDYKDGIVKVWNPNSNQMALVQGVALRRNENGHEILIEISINSILSD